MIGHRISGALAVAALTVGLAACSTPAIDSTTAAQLQDTVVAVAEHASSGDGAAAVAQLDELQAQLDSAVDADLITAARAARVQAAIDTVRADLETLAAPEPEASPAPEDPAETTPVDDGGGQGDDDGADGGAGNDNRGPGNNNGKGKGSKDD